MAVKLAGRYDLNKSNLLRNDLHLVIGTRHKASPNKPKNFLLHRSGKDHFYLSSLYPVQDAAEGSRDAQIWHFDYQGGKYTLAIKQAENQAEISPINSTDSINNVELGSLNYPKLDPDAAA